LKEICYSGDRDLVKKTDKSGKAFNKAFDDYAKKLFVLKKRAT
jgi:hypothetical protein